MVEQLFSIVENLNHFNVEVCVTVEEERRGEHVGEILCLIVFFFSTL